MSNTNTTTTLSKRNRVIFTIFIVTLIAAMMLLFLGRISRQSSIIITVNTPTSITKTDPSSLLQLVDDDDNTTTLVLTSSSSKTTTTTKYRILAFGDSLTAGMSERGSVMYYPYTEFLEKKLNDDGYKDNIIVDYRGMPGWTTGKMLDNIDDPSTGLRTAINIYKDDVINIVIILAGTNDLGHGYSSEQITNQLIRLHNICYEYDTVQYTIALGIPSSGYQSRVEKIAELAKTINTNLEQYANHNNNNNTQKMIYIPFPFQYELNGINWSSDTLHFSKHGYQLLGEYLANIIEEKILLNNNKQDSLSTSTTNDNNNDKKQHQRPLRKKNAVA